MQYFVVKLLIAKNFIFIPIRLIKWSIWGKKILSITRQKFCYLVVLNKKFLTQLASDLLPQIEQVLMRVDINYRQWDEKL